MPFRRQIRRRDRFRLVAPVLSVLLLACSSTDATQGGESAAAAASGGSANDGARASALAGSAGEQGSTSSGADVGVDATTSGAGSDGQGAPPPPDAGRARDSGTALPDLGGGPITTSSQHLDIRVHDPSMIWDGKRYYLFATGGSLSIRSSADLLQWSNAGRVFAGTPSWVTTALGSDPGSLWAPDVSYFNGRFHVYYAGSTFGSNLSVIGLATSPTLDSTRPDFAFVDEGVVVQSKKGDNFNAIDPNVGFDESGTPWLVFGSFWTGIKLRKLDPATGKPAADDAMQYALASRAGGGAIEAPSIVSHNSFYYLFVSFDVCCKGTSSTYRTMVGRANKITGPYSDKAGGAMTQGAAEQLLATSGRYIGPGGGTAFRDGDNYLYVFHYYDGQDNGVSKLQIRPVTWGSNDWPVLGDPLFP